MRVEEPGSGLGIGFSLLVLWGVQLGQAAAMMTRFRR